MRIACTLIGTSLILAYSVMGALLMNNWAVAVASGVPLEEAIAEMQIANQTYSIVPGVIFASFGAALAIVWTVIMLSPRLKVPAWAGITLWSGIIVLGAPAYFFASFSNLNSVGDTFFDWNASAAFRLELPLYFASGLAVLVGLTASISAVVHEFKRGKGLTPLTSPGVPPCPVCDEVVVHSSDPTLIGNPISIDDTTQALIDLTAAGKMRVLRADVPLEDMGALAESELRYTIVCFLECQRCRATKFWGLCIRGEPFYRTFRHGAEKDWPWEPVPPRTEWAK